MLFVVVIVIVVLAVAHTHKRTFGSFRIGRFFAWQNFLMASFVCARVACYECMKMINTAAHGMRARQRQIDSSSERTTDGLVKLKNLVLAETRHNKNKCVKFTQAQKLMPMRV